MHFLRRVYAITTNQIPNLLVQLIVNHQDGTPLKPTEIQHLQQYVHRNHLLQRGYNLPVYRGMVFKTYRPFSRLKQGVLSLGSRRYESWIKNKSIAFDFASYPHDAGWKYGIIVQRPVERDDIIVDIDYLSDLGFDWNDKEILMTPFCQSCPISAVKIIRVQQKHIAGFAKAIEEQGWKADITEAMRMKRFKTYDFAPHTNGKRFQRVA